MEISTFNNEEFGEIRTIQENGEVLFCGADIAKALGYSNTRDALSRHCKGVVKCDSLCHKEGFPIAGDSGNQG